MFFCKNSYIAWLFSYLFGTVYQSYVRDCLLGFSPQKVCRIKYNSHLLGCAIFFSRQSIYPFVSQMLPNSFKSTKLTNLMKIQYPMPPFGGGVGIKIPTDFFPLTSNVLKRLHFRSISGWGRMHLRRRKNNM